VLDRFLKSQRTKGRRSTDKVKTLLDKDATAYWRHRQIASITPSDVVERIEAIVGRGAPVSASRFRAWVSKLFNYTVKAQLRPDNPAASTENPVDASPLRFMMRQASGCHRLQTCAAWADNRPEMISG
jgi:site-specific recombinase XerD